MAEVAGVGALQALPSDSLSLSVAHGAQCALLSLPAIVWFFQTALRKVEERGK